MNRLLKPVAVTICAWLSLWSTSVAAEGSGSRISDLVDQLRAAAIHQAVHASEERLRTLAVDSPEVLQNIFQQAFGDRLSAPALESLLKDATRGTLSFPENVTFVDVEILGDASAAYLAGDGGLILLSLDHLDDPELLQELLTEEWGHHLDAGLGEGDARGDEGEIFARAAKRGAPLDDLTFFSLTRQRDHAEIAWNGEVVEVELGFGKWLKKAGNSVAKTATTTVKAVAPVAKTVVKKTVKVTQVVATGVAEATVNTVKATGSAISNLGQSVGNAALGTVNTLNAVGAAMAGDAGQSAAFAAKADRNFSKSEDLALKGANNVLDAVTAPGDAYIKTQEKLDEVVPFLGTVLDIGLSLTPAGPYLAVAKGASQVTAAAKEGDVKGALIAGGFAALEVGGAKLGRYAKATKVAQTSSKASKLLKATDTAADAALAANRAKTAAVQSSKAADEAYNVALAANKAASRAPAAQKAAAATNAADKLADAERAARQAAKATAALEKASDAASAADKVLDGARSAVKTNRYLGAADKVLSVTDPRFLTKAELARGTRLATYLAPRPGQSFAFKALVQGGNLGKLFDPNRNFADYIYKKGAGERWKDLGRGIGQGAEGAGNSIADQFKKLKVQSSQLRNGGSNYESFIEAPAPQLPEPRRPVMRRESPGPPAAPAPAPAPPPGGSGGGGGTGGSGGTGTGGGMG